MLAFKKAKKSEEVSLLIVDKLMLLEREIYHKLASTSGEKSSKQNFLAVNLRSKMTSLDESNFRKSSASERLFFIPFQVFIATR